MHILSTTPLRYVDSTGHWYGPDEYDPAGIEWDWEREEFAEMTGDENILRWHPYPLREPLPESTPEDYQGSSGIGAYGSINTALSFLTGVNLEIGGGWLYNKHSKELGFFIEYGGSIEVAMPKMLEVGISGGILFPRNYSSNDMLPGLAIESGGELGIDLFGELGLDVGRSWEIDLVEGFPVPAYDPKSQSQPYVDYVGASAGFNFVPDGLQASVTSGLSHTPLVVTVQVPW